MEPSKKSEAMEQAITDMLGGTRRSAFITAHQCNQVFGCGKAAIAFRDERSRREFSISGLCQKCQDSVFGEVLDPGPAYPGEFR